MRILIGLLVVCFGLVGQAGFSSETYNCSYFTQTDVGVTTTSTLMLQKNSMRRCLVFQNHAAAGASGTLIKFGSAHTGTEGYYLAGASTTWEPIHTPTGAIYMKSTAGGFSTTILEGK